MPRKPAKRREPTPMDEGAAILDAATKAGADYAMEQVGSGHFRDWVYDQMVEAERMRAADPGSVFPSDTPAGAKKAARNMLQQLEWDTKRQMDPREVLDLSGAKGAFESGSAAWVRDTYGITVQDVTGAFFDSFVEELNRPSTREWLTDEVLLQSEELRGSGVREARRAPQRRGLYRVIYLIRGRRASVPATLQFDAAMREFTALKRRGLTAWIESDSGEFVPVEGAVRKPAEIAEGRRRHSVVRNFIAVDTNDRRIAGPSKDYAAMKREAEKRRGYVKFTMQSRRRPARGPAQFPKSRRPS